jgi:UDP-3-O-[3-hydroxymyristoyl] glucosamine N-acyltransferase
MPALTVSQIAAICDGQIEGPEDRVLCGANTLQDVSEDQLSFAANQKAFALAAASKAGCLLVPPDYPYEAAGRSLIRVDNPRLAFASAIRQLYAKPPLELAIHPTAIIAPSASVASDCFIGPYVTVGGESSIGSRCVVHAGSRIGARVVIGADGLLHPNVTIYDDVRIGARVILHTGCVLGADGFGFTLVEDHYEKFPQVGIVSIGDDVEIGANSCVDRAALGVTAIGDGTKLDNLVHVGHNCTIGRHVVIAAQAGLSGSVTIGDYAAIGGQAGIGEKAKIEPKAIVGGKSGILTSQKISAGEPVWGIPARPLRQHLKGLAHVAKLEKTSEEIRSLRRRLDAIDTQPPAK